jgi:hypothetical protein
MWPFLCTCTSLLALHLTRIWIFFRGGLHVLYLPLYLLKDPVSKFYHTKSLGSNTQLGVHNVVHDRTTLVYVEQGPGSK